MTRPTRASMANAIEARNLNMKGLASDQSSKLRILERTYRETGDAAVGATLARAYRNEVRPTGLGSASAEPKRRLKARSSLRRKEFGVPSGFDEVGAVSGRSYSSRAAERMEAKQAGFPNIMRHPTTIGLAMLPMTADLALETNKWRRYMRSALEKLTAGSQISGGFQIVMKSSRYLASILPASELPECADPENRPDDLYAYLHWHGIIADPWLSKKEVRGIVVAAFPGNRRVCVAKVQPERIDPNGELTHGPQGWFEYAMLQKTEIDFSEPQMRIDAIIAYARIDATWSRSNRNFSMGKPLDVSRVRIDPDRVAELELNENLAGVKRKWEKLTYAEQFIHLWFSGVVQIIRKPFSWLKLGVSQADRLRTFLVLVRKWSILPDWQDIDFFDFVRPALE